MNTILTFLKATGISFTIFWSIISTKGIDFKMIPWTLVSLFPIAIIVTLVISITIIPFYAFNKETKSYREIYNTYFPYYSVVAFILCAYGIIKSEFEIDLVAFFSAAFITTCKSWQWLTNSTKL